MKDSKDAEQSMIKPLCDYPVGARVRVWCIGLDWWDPDTSEVVEKNDFFVLIRYSDGTDSRLLPSVKAIDNKSTNLSF